MKKFLLFLVAMTATCGLFADDWQKPVYSRSFQPLTAGETMYIYNTEAQLFLTEGNDWGTHATVGESGLLATVEQYAPADTEWDEKTYIILISSVKNGSVDSLFITDGGHVYVDCKGRGNNCFSFRDMGRNTYQIYGADINPVWNATGDNAGYMLGRYTKYVNEKDAIETGTGVIYDDNGSDSSYGAGEFQATWAFVSQDDYAAYGEQVKTYQTAMMLKEALDKAAGIGVPDLDNEKAIYANTASDTETLESAIESVNKKTLAYYEVYVTPDKPMDISTDDCNSIDGWTNEINATTWGTQSWIGDGWTGFEGTTLNIWGASLNGFADKTLNDLPNGIYVVSMAVYSEKLEGYVFANRNQKAVGGGVAGATYEVTTNVTDGTLMYGFGQDIEGTNWVAIDNATVKYYGSGTDALKYWLNSLKESTVDYSNVNVQSSLVDEYNQVMTEVNAAQTEEAILAVIPKMEDIINRIDLNIAAYEELEAAISKANELINNENTNTLYGDKLGDDAGEKENILQEHNLSTEEVQKATAELNTLADEAQNYIWQMEKLTEELTTAESIYLDYKEECTEEAANAYTTFVEKYAALSKDNLKVEDADALLSELYAIEFNLQVPAAPASDDNPVDYTAKIYNPTFVGVDGWTNDGWSTFSNNTWYGFANEEGASSGDGNYLNLWNEGNATAYQAITGLPAGAYEVSCGAYADNEGFELFANDNTVVVTVGKSEADEYMRIYTIPVIVGEDGALTIGARNTNGGTAWSMVDEYHLTYYGTESKIITSIDTIAAPAKSIKGTYNLAGQQVDDSYKGIVIKNGKRYLQK